MKLIDSSWKPIAKDPDVEVEQVFSFRAEIE